MGRYLPGAGSGANEMAVQMKLEERRAIRVSRRLKIEATVWPERLMREDFAWSANPFEPCHFSLTNPYGLQLVAWNRIRTWAFWVGFVTNVKEGLDHYCHLPWSSNSYRNFDMNSFPTRHDQANPGVRSLSLPFYVLTPRESWVKYGLTRME